MQRVSFEGMHCSVAQALEVVGEWWTLLIIRDSFLGVRRFEDWVERLGISRNILTQRLDRLVETGVLTKELYNERPPRYEYRLTDKGRDLWPVVTAMRQWGDRWAAPDGPPIEIVHESCGQVVQVVPTCSFCGERLDHRDVRVVSGPGARDDLVDGACTA